jgi:hypothetical protein
MKINLQGPFSRGIIFGLGAILAFSISIAIIYAAGTIIPGTVTNPTFGPGANDVMLSTVGDYVQNAACYTYTTWANGYRSHTDTIGPATTYRFCFLTMMDHNGNGSQQNICNIRNDGTNWYLDTTANMTNGGAGGCCASCVRF